LSIGVMSLIGNACGEKNFSLASHITLSAIKIALGFAFIASIIFIGFSDYLVQSFMIPTESSAYRLAIFMIGMLPLYCVFDAINFVFSATLRACGDTLFCLKINAAGQWVCLFICFYGAFYLHFSPETLWSLFIITLSIQSLFLVCRYLKGAWKEEKSLKMN
ncbi:MAG: MATE family efflux transporter, partial [Parachlamydiaceae bacterium]